ncbi:HNH endonuclease signature motif containing protein [Streptomyces sp. NPDC088789]|uniref:HNH endonuclease signature motif containing protein n=1 Tax=Streptomyces sp. NPDC088789 TaxID=3365899 RepID=UPI00382CA5F6
MRTSTYTKERLEAAARGAQTLSEALVRLGVEPTNWKLRYVRERMKALGVDMSHFEPEGVKWTRAVLEPVVAASTSVNDVLRRLGIDTVGGHHTHISRRIRAYGIDTSHFTGDRPALPGQVRRRAPSDGILVENLSEHARRIPGNRLKKAMGKLGMEERCALCGIGPVWLGDPLPLEVDHIDGQWRNNRIENLRLLCPNCHSTTASYRGRGKRPVQSGSR